MTIGASLLLIALGAVLKFAVTATVNGLDLPTIGVVLMFVGAVGLVLGLVLTTRRRRTDVIDNRRRARRRVATQHHRHRTRRPRRSAVLTPVGNSGAAASPTGPASPADPSSSSSSSSSAATVDALTAARVVLPRVAGDGPQEQADAVRAWWLSHGGAAGRPPVPFAVLALVLPEPAFETAFQAHFDAATRPAGRS